LIATSSAFKASARLAALALLPIAYGFIEARSYRIRTYRVPLLPPGTSDLTILQLSDFHLRRKKRKMIGFLESLHERSFDLVFATGDLLGDPDSVDVCLHLLNGMQGTAARCFVFGSSDYYAPILKNYLDYFFGRRRHSTDRNPTRKFRSGLLEAGWDDLNNSQIFLELQGIRIQMTGLDDPYLHRDDRRLLVRDPSAGLAILVVHDPAPYADARRAGYDLVVAGHTHGGQVRMPFLGALVTNSTLPTSLARGLSHLDPGWLFVSPGLGTGKYAPFRFLCPPEASVIHLVPQPNPEES
jgi:predicted MPP superfamily phosphohydrolase